MSLSENFVHDLANGTASRIELWTKFINSVRVQEMAEIGVYRGKFASEIMRTCSTVTRYYMIDPWRHLSHWNKPANIDDQSFDEVFAEAMERTSFAGQRVVVLRGTTNEVIDQLPDESLDFAYIDGDHSLRGISIDLIKLYPKMRVGGWVGGDDFCRTLWQHGRQYEPTVVFPYAVYFAEAVGARIYALPHEQFLIDKAADGYAFVDVTGTYDDISLRNHLIEGSGAGARLWKYERRRLKRRMRSMFPRLASFRRLLSQGRP